MGKILVVDDEKDSVKLLKYILEKSGHQVLEAYSGQEALATLGIDSGETPAEGLPELIILDVMMPKIDGYSLASRIREAGPSRDIPIIVVSAKGATLQLFENVSGVTAYLEKPFDPELIRQEVKKALEGRKNP
ncbi:MAG: response regulator [Elusimicrobia bacterium]|nr:response regulator [Elusimicrobiota bacterium]